MSKAYLENLFGLEGKVAVITGGGAIGTSMTKAMAKAGMKIAVLDLFEDKAKALAAEVTAEGGICDGYGCNVLEQATLESVRDQVLAKWGKVDVLINGAGGNMPGATIAPDQTVFDMKLEDFRKVMDLNLVGSVIPSLVFGKVMADQKKGVVINISSMTATQAVTRVFGYSVSKSGIDSLTRWLSTEFNLKFGDGLRVNAIAPGFFIGEQNRRLLNNEDGSLTDRGNTIIQNTPMKRFGEIDELNGTLLWLISDAASFVTGVVVPVDGGFSSFSGV
jgi:NAD(P)-dependent dehydrogenase (short-subunit alcohol dehydrogenase family)